MSAEAPLVPVLADGKRPQRIENGLAIKTPHRRQPAMQLNASNMSSSIKHWQGAVRKTVTSMQWEMSMFVIVLMYFVVVFAAFALSDQKIARLICSSKPNNTGWITPSCKTNILSRIEFIFYTVDFAFLVLFFIEICIKFFGLGVIKYLKDVVNAFDFVIIVLSIALTVVVFVLPDLLLSAKEGLSLVPLTRAAKVARLLRVVLIMTRMQRSRSRYRRNKMVGFAAPVEKVFEIIGDLRRKDNLHPEDDRALALTMDLIAKEELHKVNFTDSKQLQGVHLTTEMTDWLRSNLRTTLPSGPLRNSTDKALRISAQATRAQADERQGELQFLSSPVPAWIARPIDEASIVSVLGKMHEWDFDVFTLDEMTHGHPLVVGGIHLFSSMGVLEQIPVPKEKLATFLQCIERGYVASNPFHNALHAADVMFTTHYFMQSPLLRGMTGALDKFTAVLAGALHDFAHPGVSNAFLVATRSETAVMYNDLSVLEMFHVSGAFRVMLSTAGCDLAEFMSRDQFRQFRETLVSMVLSTDLKLHFEHLGRLKARLATDAYASVERKDVLLLLGQALHAADISNPAKPRVMQLRWTERVMKEFWKQGDQELSFGLPISAFMDRRQPQVPQCQIGFITVLVKPLFIEWHKLLGDVTQPAIDCIEDSLKLWREEGSNIVVGWESEE